jgi:hypothetical protein
MEKKNGIYLSNWNFSAFDCYHPSVLPKGRYNRGTGSPTIVLDAGLSGTSLGWSLVHSEVSKFTNHHDEVIWNDFQKKLLTKSNQAKQLIANQSDYMINHHQPQIIVEAIQEMSKEKKCP